MFPSSASRSFLIAGLLGIIPRSAWNAAAASTLFLGALEPHLPGSPDTVTFRESVRFWPKTKRNQALTTVFTGLNPPDWLTATDERRAFSYGWGEWHHEFLPQGRTVNKEYYLEVMRRLRKVFILYSYSKITADDNTLALPLPPKMMSVWKSNAWSLLFLPLSYDKTNTLQDADPTRASLWRRGIDTIKHWCNSLENIREKSPT